MFNQRFSAINVFIWTSFYGFIVTKDERQLCPLNIMELTEFDTDYALHFLGKIQINPRYLLSKMVYTKKRNNEISDKFAKLKHDVFYDVEYEPSFQLLEGEI